MPVYPPSVLSFVMYIRVEVENNVSIALEGRELESGTYEVTKMYVLYYQMKVGKRCAVGIKYLQTRGEISSFNNDFLLGAMYNNLTSFPL